MNPRERNPASDDGFSLVELLVVMTLLAAIGSIVAMSVTRGLQADAQARDRIEAFESMQIAMERMSREIRSANDPSANHPLATAEDNEIRFQTRRLGEDCLEFRYRLDGDAVIASQRSSSDDCETITASPWSHQVLVRGIDLNSTPDIDSIFAYYDEEREALAPGFAVTEVSFVEIRFVRALVHDQRPVTVQSTVGLRNR